jgi:nicotinate-nucleotide pyrophosphorylase (carboxylating)
MEQEFGLDNGMSLDRLTMREIVERALQEDLGSGDVTTEALFEPDQTGRAVIRTKEPCVLAGLPIAQFVFELLDEKLRFVPQARDGERIAARQAITEIDGPLRSILMGERTALNFLQRMSGIATLIARFVEALEGLSTQILDTRKTAPGLRILDKYAVWMGGGHNHRLGLYDGVLIKSNHARLAGGVGAALRRARGRAPTTLKIEVEVSSLSELAEALKAGADIIMLDNMSLDEMRQAVERAEGRALLEASGGVTLENVRAIAETGVDFISVGALTHSPKAIDMNMEVFST